jgi:hypothetical protein
MGCKNGIVKIAQLVGTRRGENREKYTEKERIMAVILYLKGC